MKALMGKGESLLALTIKNYLRILEDLDPVTAERYNALLENIQQKYRVTEDWSNLQEKEIAIRRDLKALLDDLAPRIPLETDLLPNNWDILSETLQIELTILKRLYALKIEIEESIEKQKTLNSCEKVLDLTPKTQ